MPPSTQEVAERIRDMSDDELIQRFAAGTFTESATPIALAELAARGLPQPEPTPLAELEQPYEGDYVTVGRFLNPTDAYVICSCLEAGGVPAIVADANLAQTNSLWAIAMGGARVLVPSMRVAEAREVIDAFNRGDFSLRDDEDVPDD